MNQDVNIIFQKKTQLCVRTYFVYLAFYFLTSVKSEKEKGCLSCRKNVLKVFGFYKSEYELGIVNINKDKCDKMSDSEDCNIKITEWWPYLSQIIYSDNAPKFVCKVLDPNCTVK